MNGYSIEEATKIFMKEAKFHKILNVNDETEQKLINELKRCIQFDVIIQRLIKQSEEKKFNFNGEDVIPYVNLMNLHNFFIANTVDDPNLNGIHIDNMGFYSFEFLENKLKESSIYLPKRKAKLKDIKEVNYDKLLKEFDNAYYQSRRLSDDGKNQKKDRSSLTPKQQRLLTTNECYSPKYYNFISRQYTNINHDTKEKKICTAWYTPISSANVMSFLLFYNRPFQLPSYYLFNGKVDDLIEKSIEQLKRRNKKSVTNNAIRSLIYNIMCFIDDKHLNNYLEESNYHQAVFVDKVLFLAKVDYFYNWVIFTSCFDDSYLYLKGEVDNDFANEYFMKKTSIPYKRKDTAINYLFFTKWYLLSLAKFIRFYNNFDFIKLLESVIEYYDEISKKEIRSNQDLLSDLYKSKEILDLMIIHDMEKESREINVSLLVKLTSIYCKKLSPVIKIKNLNDFINMFPNLLNNDFEKK